LRAYQFAEKKLQLYLISISAFVFAWLHKMLDNLGT
jgi:hypothetical protein